MPPSNADFDFAKTSFLFLPSIVNSVSFLILNSGPISCATSEESVLEVVVRILPSDVIVCDAGLIDKAFSSTKVLFPSAVNFVPEGIVCSVSRALYIVMSPLAFSPTSLVY